MLKRCVKYIDFLLLKQLPKNDEKDSDVNNLLLLGK